MMGKEKGQGERRRKWNFPVEMTEESCRGAEKQNGPKWVNKIRF
jgi:hypothetical protein